MLGRYLAALAGRVGGGPAAGTAGPVRRRCAALALAAATAVGAHTSPAVPLGAPPAQHHDQRPARVVVLVDASDGVPPAVLARERGAARLISRLGRATGTAPDVLAYGRSAGTRADGLLRATGVLDRHDGPRVIFLFAGVRTRPGTADLSRALARARAAGVAVWPVGFGDVDRDELARYAEKGHQGRCRAAPSASVVADARDATVVDVFAQAGCLGHARAPVDGGRAWIRVPPGAEVVVVAIPGRAGVELHREHRPPPGYRAVHLGPSADPDRSEMTVLWTFPG
ncbi:hypothetical protein ABZ816_18935 [Actinosynnema sp. NPDC047251]|uniref:hypothetical protein n=1 Tax=Saccharothrix espanaensis TaxID=103731 RepID=UPI0002DC75BF|nr:hypothetical protein [Saccharothrix espanaensis]